MAEITSPSHPCNGPILNIAIPAPLARLFDYLPHPDETTLPSPGTRVNVSFGRQQCIGIVMGHSHHSALPRSKLKPIHKSIDATPVLPETILRLCQFSSQYYHYPIGEITAYALPRLLRLGKMATIRTRATKSSHASPLTVNPDENPLPPTLTPAQQQAVETINLTTTKANFQSFLLEGITGSGKTEVYLRVIHDAIDRQQQALILVPEISLTPQTIQRFEQRFTQPVVCLHSRLTDRERLNNWLLAAQGEAKIVIGTRSAIFTPLPNLGIIIVDESHDASYKQQEGFRYSARDLAMVRGKMAHLKVILGSATPSLETLYNVKKQRYQHLCLPHRVGNASLPKMKIIDARGQCLAGGLVTPILNSITQHLDQDNQVLIFLNRRGFAPTILCHQCGFIADCHYCDAHLVFHQKQKQLRCHHCGNCQPVITHCPKCQSIALNPVGYGTERIEKTLSTHFPDTPIIRIDKDTTRQKNALQTLLASIHQGSHQILIGTQMLAKGHHFPNVTLVVMLNVDGAFLSADFRAIERTAQLMIQVAGRAGRAEKPGEVLIQSHQPDNPLLTSLIYQGYHHFTQTILKQRQHYHLPPYSHLVLFRADARTLSDAENWLQQIKQIATRLPSNKAVEWCGPIPAPMQRCAGRFRAQLLLQSSNRQSLQALLTQLLNRLQNLPTPRRVRFSIDVDPLEMF